MKTALRADVAGGFEILLPDDLPAPFALLPQALGAHAALAIFRFGALVVLAAVSLKPRHATIYLNAGTDAPARLRKHDIAAQRAWRARVHAGRSWRKAKSKDRRERPIRQGDRRVPRSGKSDRGPPFRPSRSGRRRPRSPSSCPVARASSCGKVMAESEIKRSARAAHPAGRPSCPPIRKIRSRPSISAFAIREAKAAEPIVLPGGAREFMREGHGGKRNQKIGASGPSGRETVV